MGTRRTLRLYWEAVRGRSLPEGEDLVEENWTPFWRESLRPVQVTPRITLVPAWEEGVSAAPVLLKVDPGMAFGSGDHPTTRRCLTILDTLAQTMTLPARVLDVGAGTGVLSLACASLGARSVEALDIDPFCFAACRRNAALNGLEGRIRPLLLSLDLLEGEYPLVLANMVASQLEATAQSLLARLSREGLLLLSGFQVSEERRVRDLFGRETAVEVREEEEEWLALLVRRKEWEA